ncbi:MAG TPA: peroxiredoxin [Solirubrobacteraceae bacterium]|jgi:peroxiredoxin|nr:peroxiredoxin [Solirubrobacteraceae bacterium]
MSAAAAKRPVDDGGAAHLRGQRLPAVWLPATDGTAVQLDALRGWAAIFAHPRIARPGEQAPGGDAAWDALPGARGCTAQACALRDAHRELAEAGATVLGLSTQSTREQVEAATRLRLPYLLLSDAALRLATAIDLPTFTVAGVTLLRRLTLIVHDGWIEEVLYPVFPAEAAAADALERLRALAA